MLAVRGRRSPPAARRRSTSVWAAALLSAFVALAVTVERWGPLPGERWVLRALRDGLGTSFDRSLSLLAAITDSGPLAMVATVIVGGLLVTGHRRAATAVTLSVLVVWLGNPLLKEIVERPRPSVRALPLGLSQYSFPSGHAANTLALVVATVLVAPVRWRRLAVCFGAAALGIVAFGQLGLGVHYPSDILAGWLWAGGWVAAVRSVLAPRRRGPSTGPADAAPG